MLRRATVTVLLSLTFSAGVRAANPVDIHGRLLAQGNRIVGEKSGDTVQLAGMSFFWNNWMGQFWTPQVVDWLVNDFHCSILRAAMGADFVDASGAMSGIASPADIHTGMQMTETIVDQATRRGIYSIVDWHSHHAPAHLSDAIGYFDTLSALYGDNPGVVFEIFNEPWSNDYTWEQIKAYANSVIPVIRKHSRNLIVVGSREWSRDLDEATRDPVVDSNMAYTLHFYAGSHGDSLRWQGDSALSRGKAVFVTEWGTTLDDGGSDGKIYTAESNRWLAWLDSNRISSCNWSVENKAEAAAILTGTASTAGGWDTTKDLTPSGRFVRAAIRARNTQYTFGPEPIDSSLLPGRIQAETCVKDSMLTKNTNSGSDSLYLGNSALKSWAQWNVTMPQARKVSMSLRVASDRTTGFTVKINGTLVNTTSFPTTGGWGDWATISTDSFEVPSGPLTVRIDWTNVMDLDWFEFHGHPDSGQAVLSDPPDSSSGDSLRVYADANAAIDPTSGMYVNGTGTAGYFSYSQNGSWAEFQLTTSRQEMAVIAMRVATPQDTAKVALKVGATTLATVKVPNTGNWGNSSDWQTIASDSVQVPAGTFTLHLSWIGQFDLNWVELRAAAPSQVAIRPGNRPVLRARWTETGIHLDLPAAGRVQVLDALGRPLVARNASQGALDLPVPDARGRLFVHWTGAQGAQTLPVMAF